MKVQVKLFAKFRDGREDIQTLEVEEGTTPEEIYRILGIDNAEVGRVLENGIDKEKDTKLADGDTLSIFPPVGGG